MIEEDTSINLCLPREHIHMNACICKHVHMRAMHTLKKKKDENFKLGELKINLKLIILII